MFIRLGIATLVLGIAASACSPSVVDSAAVRDSDTAHGTPTVAAASPDDREACENPATDVPWASDSIVAPVILSEGTDTVPRVEAVTYPHPEYEGNPWSQWGQGLVLDDGRYISAIGDHRGPDGNSYVFEYDPAIKALTQIVDVLAIADHTPGDWGFGKIHAQMSRGPCNSVMVATYWGTRRDIEFTTSYQGDVLMSLDPQHRTVGIRGVV